MPMSDTNHVSLKNCGPFLGWKIQRAATRRNTWIEDTLKLKLRKKDVLKHNATLTGGGWTIEADDIEVNREPL
jgi:hypothetical protein